MRVIYRGLGIPTQSWTMPNDRHLFAATWWRIGDAARAWGCTRSTAKRLIDRHYGKVGRYTVQIVTPHGRSLRTVIPADTPDPAARKATRTSRARSTNKNLPSAAGIRTENAAERCSAAGCGGWNGKTPNETGA